MYKRNPLRWLLETVKTVDNYDRGNPVKLFPALPYVPELVELFFNEEFLWVEKSRRMVISWLFVSLCLHEAIFAGYQKIFLVSKKEKDATDLVLNMWGIYNRQPVFIKNLSPVIRPQKDQQKNQLELVNGSVVSAVPQGSDQIRGATVTRLFIDEAAFLDNLEEFYGASVPALIGGGKMVAVSTAYPGYFQKMVQA
jgi:phage FluMu gp28-like protein